MRTTRADAARLERARDAEPTPGAKLAFVSNMVQHDRGVARALRVAEVPTESEADHGGRVVHRRDVHRSSATRRWRPCKRFFRRAGALVELHDVVYNVRMKKLGRLRRRYLPSFGVLVVVGVTLNCGMGDVSLCEAQCRAGHHAMHSFSSTCGGDSCVCDDAVLPAVSSTATSPSASAAP